MSKGVKMSRSQKGQTQKLDHVKQLVYNGQYNEAWQILELLENKKELTLYEQFICQLFRSQIKIKRGNNEEGLSLAEQLLNESQGLSNPILEIDTYVVMTEALDNLERFDDSLYILNQAEEFLVNVVGETVETINQRKAELLNIKGRVLRRKGDMDQALTCLKESLSLREEYGNKQQVAESLSSIGRYYSTNRDTERALKYFEQSLALLKEGEKKRDLSQGYWNIGSIFCQQGNLSRALKYFEKSRKVSEEVGDKIGLAQAFFCSGAMYHDMGELDQALKYQQQNLRLFKEIDSQLEIATSLTQVGFIFLSRGDLDRALECHQQSLDLYNKLGRKDKSAWTLVGIGESYRQKGELDRALTFFEESLNLRKESSHMEDIADSLYFISKIHHQQGKLEKALSILEQSLNTFDDLGRNLSMTGVLLDLVSVALDKHSFDLATQYFHRLEQINDQEENKIIHQRYRLAKALILKHSSRIRDKAQAQEIFQQIVEEKVVKHQLTVIAMFNLCDSLLDELRAYGEIEVLLEAQTLAGKINILAQHQSSLSLNVNTLILQAKFAMVKGNLSTAEKFLDQAKKQAEKNNLGFLISKVSEERQHLEEEYSSWQKLIQDNAPFQERLKKAEIKDYIKEALNLARVDGGHKRCE